MLDDVELMEACALERPHAFAPTQSRQAGGAPSSEKAAPTRHRFQPRDRDDPTVTEAM